MMKPRSSFLLLCFLFLVLAARGFSAAGPHPDDWWEINQREFSFAIPASLFEERKNGIDTSLIVFTDAHHEIELSLTWAGQTNRWQEPLPGAEPQPLTIGSNKVVILATNNGAHRGLTFAWAARIIGHQLTVHLSSQKETDRALFESILRTLQMTQPNPVMPVSEAQAFQAETIRASRETLMLLPREPLSAPNQAPSSRYPSADAARLAFNLLLLVHDEAVPRLATVLLAAPDKALRSEAVRALYQAHPPRPSIVALSEALRKEATAGPESLAGSMAEALGATRHPDALPALKFAYESGVMAAAHAIGRIGDEKWFQLLLPRTTETSDGRNSFSPYGLLQLVQRSNKPVEPWMEDSGQSDWSARSPTHQAEWTAWWNKNGSTVRVTKSPDGKTLN